MGIFYKTRVPNFLPTKFTQNSCPPFVHQTFTAWANMCFFACRILENSRVISLKWEAFEAK